MRTASPISTALLYCYLLIAGVAQADEWRYPWDIEAPWPPLSLLYCPNALLAGHCGNGRCELGESMANCPYDCSEAPVKNWNADTVCSQGAQVSLVHTVDELQQILRTAARDKRHLRVLGARHSDNALICSSDLLVDMTSYHGVEGLEKGHHGEAVVRVRGGTDLFTVLTWLYDRGLMLEGYAMPAYREGTIAGIVATSSHGGSLSATANFADLVDELTLVTATGEVKSYGEGLVSPREWQAARANLGLLGVVVSVRLKVRPYHNLHVDFAPYPEEQLLTGALLKTPRDCAWSLYYWSPRQHHVERICGNETDAAADPRIENTSIKQGALTGEPVTDAVYLGGLTAAVCDYASRCLVNNLATSDALFKGYFTRPGPHGERLAERHFTGLNHLITTSASGDLRTVAFRTYEVTIAEASIVPALAAIQKAVASDPCGLLGDISIRFTPTSNSTLVGLNAAGTGSGRFAATTFAMHLEINGYAPPGLSSEQQKDANRFNDDLVRQLIGEFGARPHWGKGQSWVLRYAARSGVYGTQLAEFAALVKAADPQATLVNPLAEAILSAP